MRKMSPQKALIQKKGCCGSAAAISVVAESADVESVAATCVHAESATAKNAAEKYRRGMTPGDVGEKKFPKSATGEYCRDNLPGNVTGMSCWDARSNSVLEVGEKVRRKCSGGIRKVRGKKRRETRNPH